MLALQASKTQTVVKLTVVPCPPVVEVLIKRPDVKYQLGFSVQNGVVGILLFSLTWATHHKADSLALCSCA